MIGRWIPPNARCDDVDGCTSDLMKPLLLIDAGSSFPTIVLKLVDGTNDATTPPMVTITNRSATAFTILLSGRDRRSALKTYRNRSVAPRYSPARHAYEP